MMNLISFETPPLGRQESTATTTTMKVKEASSSSTCFHSSHLDLSLGISLSHGASSCDAASCGGAKASYGARRGCGGDVGGCMSSGMITTSIASTNMLSAGHGCHDIVSSGSWTSAFMPSPTGFMHPWSLAARQQKAAAEQDRSLATAPATTYVPRDACVVPLPAAVGWPPVHTSRRNLVATMHVPKPDTAVKLDGSKGAKTAAVDEKNAAAPRNCTVAEARPANMFAKVHMDGYLIGRKINLRAHRSYDSLSRVLTKMTRNFFCPADYSSSNSGEEDCANSDDYIFLYEDFEGDRMLVGDVPWELFLASAKRLYIARNPASGDRKGHDEAAKRDAN